MSIKTYITTQLIQIIHFNEITQYRNTITVDRLFYKSVTFTYQRKGNQELQIQAFNNIVAGLQNQTNNFTFAGSGPNEPIIGII